MSPQAVGVKVTICQAPESVVFHNSTLLPRFLSSQTPRREARSRNLPLKWVECGHEIYPGRQLRSVFSQGWETWQGRARESCEVATLKRKVNSIPEVRGQTCMTIDQAE